MCSAHTRPTNHSIMAVAGPIPVRCWRHHHRQHPVGALRGGLGGSVGSGGWHSIPSAVPAAVASVAVEAVWRRRRPLLGGQQLTVTADLTSRVRRVGVAVGCRRR
jgi:hypothetical protein